MTITKKSFLFLTLLLLLPACSGKSKEEETQIRQVVKWYNEALVRAYKELDIQSLNGLTTADEIGRVRMIVWKFKAEKKYMESEQKELIFKSIEITGPESADVETAEKWRFRHLREKTGTQIQPWKDENYTMYYRMAKMEGKWIVEKARLVKEDLEKNPNLVNHSSFMKKPAP